MDQASGSIPDVAGDYSPPADMPSLLEVMESEAASAGAAPSPAVVPDDGPGDDGEAGAGGAGEAPHHGEPAADEPSGEPAGEVSAEPAPKESPEDDPLAGLPKPQEFGFDPGKLTGTAKDVHRYYSSVLRHKGREYANSLKEFEGIDPGQHKQIQGFADAVIDHPLYEHVIEPLLNPQHQGHKAITQAIIQLFSGPSPAESSQGDRNSPSRGGPPDFEKMILESADEDGVIHPEALQKKFRDAVEAQVRAQPQPRPAPAVSGNEIWDAFATRHGLPPTESKHYGRIYGSLYGNSPPPGGVRPLQILERIKVIRDSEIREQMAQASRESEIERKASMSPPSRSTASAPPKPKLRHEMTLREVQMAEKEGRL